MIYRVFLNYCRDADGECIFSISVRTFIREASVTAPPQRFLKLYEAFHIRSCWYVCIMAVLPWSFCV